MRYLRHVLALVLVFLLSSGTPPGERPVRIDLEVPWGCDEAFVVELPTFDREVERIVGVACAWTFGCGELGAFPLFYTGQRPAPLLPLVVRFVIDDPAVLELFEGDGTPRELTVFRSTFGCSGMRWHGWVHLAPPAP